MINLIKNNIKKIILLSGSGSGIMFAGSRYHNNTTINSLDVIDNNNESSDMCIIGGGVVGLDIARELNVTPQAVSNWKARDKVPYKYIKKIRSEAETSCIKITYINCIKFILLINLMVLLK